MQKTKKSTNGVAIAYQGTADSFKRFSLWGSYNWFLYVGKYISGMQFWNGFFLQVPWEYGFRKLSSRKGHKTTLVEYHFSWNSQELFAKAVSGSQQFRAWNFQLARLNTIFKSACRRRRLLTTKNVREIVTTWRSIKLCWAIFGDTKQDETLVPSTSED